MVKKLTAFGLLLLAMVALATAAMVAVRCIPADAVHPGARRALFQISCDDPGLRYMADGMKFPALMKDKITDYIMVSASDSDTLSATLTPAEAAMLCPALVLGPERPDPALATRSADTFLTYEPALYGRYWHGYQLWLRPLLAVTDARGAYAAVAVTLWGLLAALCALLWRRSLRYAAGALLLSLALTAWWVVPGCFALSISWGIALAASVAILTMHRLTASPLRSALLFFAIGGFTSFSELLLTPMVAFTLPCVMLGLVRSEYRSYRAVASFAAAWCAGYALTWCAKWLMAWLITGHNFLAEVGDSVLQRTVSTDGTTHILSRFAALVAAHPVACALAAAACVALLCLAARGAHRRGTVWLLAIAAVQLAWFAFAAEHTLVHFPYTYRALAPVLLALLLSLRPGTIKLTNDGHTTL